MASLVAVALLLAAQAPATPVAGKMNRLLDCRQIAASDARLACFDRETAALQAGLASRELTVIDREGIRQTRRSLFGLSLPKLAILGGDDKEEINRIETSLAGLGRNPAGGYVFRLADGSRWSQSDDTPLAVAPRAGERTVVSRGALGSFFLQVGRQPGVKVRRLT